MTRKDDGGAAFPITPANEPRMDGTDGRGMSLRDWFAGQALAGFASTIGNVIGPKWDIMAQDAYDAADAMIAEREKGDTQGDAQ